MWSVRIIKSWFQKLLFVLLPAIYTIIISRFGYEDSDSGFITGLGWRILNGELPYRDFIYIRTPLSPFLSSILLKILPEYGQIFYLRLINSYQLLCQVTLTVLVLKKYYDFKHLRISFSTLVVLSFFITASGTLYFQWHTTDGIFFAILGLFLVEYSNKTKPIAIIAGLFFTAAFLTKQNFLLIPILAIFYTQIKHGWKKMVYVLAGILLGLFSFYKFLSNYNLFNEFLSQTTGATALKDILIAGFAYYLIKHEFFFLYIVSILFSLLVCYTYFKYFSDLDKFKRIKDSLIFFLSIFFLFIYNVSSVLITESREKLISFDRLLPVIALISLIYFLINQKESVTKHLSLITLISFSWTTSISWGGMTPIMFFTPIVFLVYYLIATHTNCLKFYNINKTVVILIILTSLSSNLVTYRSGFIWNNINDGGELSPKLSFIGMNDQILEKHKELYKALNSYPNSTILPSMPGAYYLHNMRNKMIIDWPMDVEANYDFNKLKKSINEDCEFVLLEKNLFGQPIGTQGRFYSSISSYVKENFSVVNSNLKYFNVYSKPNQE